MTVPDGLLAVMSADRLTPEGAAAQGGGLDEADRLLLIPDLLGWWATGTQVAERTNASTTGLVPVGGSTWDAALLPRLGLRLDLLPEIVEPGTVLGAPERTVRDEFGIAGDVRFTTVGSHDTASAVVGVPMSDDDAVTKVLSEALKAPDPARR